MKLNLPNLLGLMVQNQAVTKDDESTETNIKSKYFNLRCNQIGLTEKNNVLFTTQHPGIKDSKDIEYPLLCYNEKTGDIEIPFYGLDGHPLNYYKDNPGQLHAGQTKPYVLTRLHPSRIGSSRKYLIPKGAPANPYMPPNIINAYRNKECIDTLIITEGPLKALAGYVQGLFVIGIQGIHNTREKQTGSISGLIVDVIIQCKVKNIIILYDGDYDRISLKALNQESDLTKRAYSFYYALKNTREQLKDLLKNYAFDLYFAYINSRQLDGSPKGLDDLFEAFPSEIALIKEGLLSFNQKPNKYFIKESITDGISKIKESLGLNDVNKFYILHKESIADLLFVYNNKVYQFNNEKNAVFEVKGGFYDPVFKYHKDGGRELTGVKINYTNWIKLLLSFGFRRYDMPGGNFIFVRIVDQIVSIVSTTAIQDYFIKYLQNMPESDLVFGVTRKMLLEKFHAAPGNYFNEIRLSLLVNDKEPIFNTDTKTCAFLYFKNGFIACSKAGAELKDYKELPSCVWEDQIIHRDFKKNDSVLMQSCNNGVPSGGSSSFEIFLYNVCRVKNANGEVIIKDTGARLKSLCSIIGYLLHNFFETKQKAVLFTDSTVSDEPNGRTGKGIAGQALGHIKKLTIIFGKDFKSDDKHRFSKCGPATQILFLDDVMSNFYFECMFNAICEGIEVNEKNKTPYYIRSKILIASNKTIKIEGDSAKDRCLEFEFSDYYNKENSPEKEFGHWFYTDWNEEQWASFDNIMVQCLLTYFNTGLIKPAEINLSKRKLLDHTCEEFVAHMDDKKDKIILGNQYNRRELLEEFLNLNPSFKEDKKRFKDVKVFSKWLRMYADLSDFFQPVAKDDHYHSGGNPYIIFRKK